MPSSGHFIHYTYSKSHLPSHIFKELINSKHVADSFPCLQVKCRIIAKMSVDMQALKAVELSAAVEEIIAAELSFKCVHRK